MLIINSCWMTYSVDFRVGSMSTPSSLQITLKGGAKRSVGAGALVLDGSKSVDPDYKDSDLDTLLSPLTWVAWKMLTLLYFENLIQETFYEKIPALACHTFSVMNGMFATCAQGATRGMRLFCCQPYVPLLFACPWSPHTVASERKKQHSFGLFFLLPI